MAEDQNVTPQSWEEFRKTGLLFLINSILHVFGWAITFQIQDGVITSVLPSRVKYRGFSELDQEQQHIKIATWMAENANTLKQEAEA